MSQKKQKWITMIEMILAKWYNKKKGYLPRLKEWFAIMEIIFFFQVRVSGQPGDISLA